MAEAKVVKKSRIRSSNTVNFERNPDAVLDDILKIKLTELKNAYRVQKEATNKQAGLARDIMNVSLTALGGAITIKVFAKSEIIKTPFLFHLAAAGLLCCVILSLVIRLVLTHTWKSTNISLGSSDENLRTVIGDMKYHDQEHHSQAYENFEEALETEPNMPHEPWLAKLRAVVILVSIFIISLVLIAISLLLKITVA